MGVWELDGGAMAAERRARSSRAGPPEVAAARADGPRGPCRGSPSCLKSAVRLFAAAVQGHTAAIEVLGRLGADVNRTDEDCWTPVHSAADGGHACAIEALGRLGADVNLAANDAGDTPLRLATRKGHAAAADALRRLGAAS
jgi:ankyrin repeat protein